MDTRARRGRPAREVIGVGIADRVDARRVAAGLKPRSRRLSFGPSIPVERMGDAFVEVLPMETGRAD